MCGCLRILWTNSNNNCDKNYDNNKKYSKLKSQEFYSKQFSCRTQLMRLLPARLLVPARSSCSRLLPCLWKRQTNACHLVADKHASPPSKYSAPQSAQSIRRRSGTTETEPRAGAAPRPELLKPRGLDKWASFMHLIISDCSDRIECFAALLLCYSRSVLCCCCFAFSPSGSSKWKA